MDRMETAFKVFTQIMNLRMTIVAGRYGISCPGCHDLIEFNLSVFPPGLGIPRLKKSATAPAAEVVRFIGRHVDEVVFTDNSLHDEPKIIRHRIAEGFSDELAGILNREFDF
jgi:hypothetical protein